MRLDRERLLDMIEAIEAIERRETRRNLSETMLGFTSFYPTYRSAACGEKTMKDKSLAVFENYNIRRIYDEETETWYFSVVDIIQALIQQPDYQTARKYWNKLKERRLKKEGSQSVTNCHRLKLEAADGIKYLTDVADSETLLRLIQSVPSP